MWGGREGRFAWWLGFAFLFLSFSLLFTMADPIGITPDEGEEWLAAHIYVNGTLKMGLWVGTWDNDESVVYAQSNATWGKLNSIAGFSEQTLNNWTTDINGAYHSPVTFTAGAGVVNQEVNGYFIATLTNKLLHVQRRSTPSYRSSGQTFRVDGSAVIA